MNHLLHKCEDSIKPLCQYVWNDFVTVTAVLRVSTRVNPDYSVALVITRTPLKLNLQLSTDFNLKKLWYEYSHSLVKIFRRTVHFYSMPNKQQYIYINI